MNVFNESPGEHRLRRETERLASRGRIEVRSRSRRGRTPKSPPFFRAAASTAARRADREPSAFKGMAAPGLRLLTDAPVSGRIPWFHVDMERQQRSENGSCDSIVMAPDRRWYLAKIY
ncbi:MAG: hypothetical protein GX458_14395 [Phyllobacteriaceae bacterium]|nr:hypothetical protein [Phyllobacteriaceae bacterium]